MNLEHVEAVRARIEELRRRFVDGSSLRATPARGLPFESVMRQARQTRPLCPAELDPVIARAGRKHGVDPALIKAVIHTESGFGQRAVSPAGALGLMQLMPATARALGVDPLDPEQNIDGGVRYLRQQIDRFGSIETALAAYNAGPGSVVRYGGVPPYAETRRYIDEVLRNLQVYSEERR